LQPTGCFQKCDSALSTADIDHRGQLLDSFFQSWEPFLVLALDAGIKTIGEVDLRWIAPAFETFCFFPLAAFERITSVVRTAKVRLRDNSG
jgi:hypothetical protein